MYDSPVVIGNSSNPSATVIWLHGLGADGNDFVPVVKLLDLPNLRFVLPHAPYRKVTINNGYEMRAWYDLYGLSAGSREDEVGIQETQAYIEQLIEQELSNGVPSQKIVLAGFSQGGAIALYTALRYGKTLAGVIALSTYLPLKTSLGNEKSVANQATPILIAHGNQDEVISINTGKLTLDALITEKYNVQWQEFPIAHSVSIDEIDEIRTFLVQITS